MPNEISREFPNTNEQTNKDNIFLMYFFIVSAFLNLMSLLVWLNVFISQIICSNEKKNQYFTVYFLMKIIYYIVEYLPKILQKR